MAISLKSIAEGTSDTVRNTVSGTARKAMSAVPNPAQSMENLGLGVGTLVRNIREASKKEKRPATEVEQKKGNEQSAKKINHMTVQLAMANSLLKEIRNLQIKQLSAVKGQGGRGLAVKPSERRAFAMNNGMRGASVTSLAAAPTIAGGTDKTDNKKDVPFKLFESIVGLGAIWMLLPKEMKAALGKLAGNIANDLQGVVVEGIGGIIKNAWNNNAIATTVAGLYVAHITGILGFAGNAVRASIATYNFAKNFGGANASGTVAGEAAAASNTKGASVTSTAPSLTKTDAQAAVQEYNARMNSPEGARPSLVANNVAAKYNLTPEQMAQVQAGKVPALPGAAGAAVDKLRAFGKGAGVAGALVTAGTGTMEYLLANRDEKLGRINKEEASKRKGGAIGGAAGGLAGGLAGAAAGAKGGALVGASFGPMGAAVGSLIGGLAGGFAGGYAGGSSGRFIGEGLGTLSNDGRVNASSSNQSIDTNPDFDYKRYVDLVGQNESTNNYAADNRVGFVGRYQFGAAALEQFGLLKPGASRGRDRGPESAIYDPSAWQPGYSLDDFLKNAALQDKVMQMYTTAHYNALTKAGVIKTGMSGDDIAARLYTAHAGGVGGAVDYFKYGKSRTDFHFGEAASTASAAQKMKGGWSTGSVTPPHFDPNENVSSASVSSASAMKGAEFAAAQQTLDELMKALGSSGTVNIQNIINQAVREGQGSAGRDGPKRTGPSGSDAAARNAVHAVGFD